MNDNMKIIGWDDEFVCNGEAYTLLDPGEYDFTLVKVERCQYSGNSQKIPAGCPELDATLEVTDGIDTVQIIDHFYLFGNPRRLSQLFEALGTPRNQNLKPSMIYQYIGQKGRCSIVKTTYNNNEYNNVKKYIAKTENAMSGFTPAPQEQAPVQFAQQQQATAPQTPSWANWSTK